MEATTTPVEQAQPKTRIYESHHYGWQGETRYPWGDKVWVINTCKRNSGTIATHCQLNESDGSFFVCSHDSPSFFLNQLPKGTRATEKTIREAHLVALSQFEAKKNELPAPEKKATIEIGQVLFTDGPYDSNRRAVYEVAGKNFKTVLLDGSGFKMDSHVRPIEKKFGIGVYYKEGDVISVDEVNALVVTAMETVRVKEEQEAILKAQRDEIRQEKIAKGRLIVAGIPTWAVAVIVAERHKNTSDIMTDYFAHQTEEVVYLAFSAQDKDMFSEMREACSNSTDEDIRIFTTVPIVDSNGTMKTFQNKSWWHPADEHREKYSGGSGYYLKHGHSNSTGWAVSKEKTPSLETLQIAAAEGRFLIPTTAAPAAAKDGSGGSGTKCSWELNEVFSGVEIKFPSQPSTDIIARVKGAGFRFTNRGGAKWYKKQSPAAITWAKTFCEEMNNS